MGGCGPNHNEWVNDKTKLNQKKENYQAEAELSQAQLRTVQFERARLKFKQAEQAKPGRAWFGWGFV